jgi:REP element-mobilizing transposase RayT
MLRNNNLIFVDIAFEFIGDALYFFSFFLSPFMIVFHMPRKARIDAPGALHHIIVRGIERGAIFCDDIDRDRFIERLSRICIETGTQCYAWSLIPNHFHLLLKTGTTPIHRVMQKLLTGYAVSFNRRHARSGYLFQNRYKSILCQEEPYLLELVRYIHLNPLRAGIVANMKELEHFAYCGHSTLLGIRRQDWQNVQDVLHLFSLDLLFASTKYREFVTAGISMGRRNDLIGGGLIRSSGGWEQVVANRRIGVFQKSDERILGDDQFVNHVLTGAKEHMERKYSGTDLAAVISRVCDLLKCDRYDIFTPGKVKKRVHARSLFCYWAVREFGMIQTELSRLLKLSSAAVTKSVQRGEALAKERGYSFL